MAVLKETRSFRPFKSSEEYLYAMKEDLAEWLNTLYPELDINVDNFMDRLDTGVALCKHANSVRKSAEEYLVRRAARKMSLSTSMSASLCVALPITTHGRVHFLHAAKAGTFFARDNVSNFIDWCRRGLGVFECLLFETEDLIARKNEKHVILCLLDVARRGAKYGMLAPLLVQLEREIDREIAADQRALRGAGEGVEAEEEEEEEDELEQEGYNVQYGPMPQIVTNDLKSLDEMVRDLVERCRCPVQFPMIRVSEGKYRIGDTKVLIFVRILRNHVMVRVGGGWDTLSHYLDKHDPCRCKQQHRSPLSTKLILKNQGAMELNHAQVLYERSPPRTRRSSASSISSGGRPDPYLLNPATNTARPEATPAGRNRSRSPTPRRNSTSKAYNNNIGDTLTVNSRAVSNRNRSRSPTPLHNTAKINNNVGDALAANGRTTPSRNRSRSPTPRRSLQATVRTRSRSPNPQANKVRKPSSTPRPEEQQTCPETSEQTTVARADNDSGSEVSDEGYRSLGIVVNQHALQDSGAVKDAGDGRIVEKRGSVDSALSKRASYISNLSTDESDEMLTLESAADTVVSIHDEVDCCSPMNVEEDNVNYLSPKKTAGVALQKRSLPENMKYGKENNPIVDSDKSQTAKISLPADPRRASTVTVSRGSLSRMPRSRSIDNGDQFERRGSLDDTSAGLAPRNSPVYRSNRSQPGGGGGGNASNPQSRVTGKPSQNNTWSSRAKQRPALTANTFANTTSKSPAGFLRNSYQRSSLGSYGSSHSTPTKRASNAKPQESVSLTTSPTREISPLVKQILDVNDLGDDAKVLSKMREIIQHYKDIVDERLVEEDKCDAGSKLPQGPELDFTSTWVHNNGSLQGINHGAARNEVLEAAKMQATPRKDSKAESFCSKIPAPVGYRSSSIDVSRES